MARVEAAADRDGFSVSQKAEQLLEKGLDAEDAFEGHFNAYARILKEKVALALAKSGGRGPQEDEHVRQEISCALKSFESSVMGASMRPTEAATAATDPGFENVYGAENEEEHVHLVERY